jgi:8-oxo-dGTP pyrophosphatase MutT (NUDIX family)
MNGRRPHETAAREAFEEAGAVGRPDKRPVGVYPGRKRMNGSRIRCHIEESLILAISGR